MHRFPACLIILCLTSPLSADGPADNIPGSVRRVPKMGVEVSADQKRKIEAGLAELKAAIDTLKGGKDSRVHALLPDVEIFYRAVHDALVYQEFFHEREIAVAFDLLRAGIERADQLSQGKSPWTSAKGLVVRGHVSKIDGSVQPYGLVIPESYSHETARGYRLDLWFHGRGETLSELNFLRGRMRQVGQFAPADTIVLHPYGRYSNAFKFAGEVDVLEALEDVKLHYRIDADRIADRGFSMGGAASWQFAVHYADRWFAANPGAGFAETPEFLKFFQQETLNPTWYEEKLWRMYDCNLWAKNLLHCPTVAYSGELDIQKQAADVMEQALLEHGIKLTHIIGPKTKHRYHPDAKAEVERRLACLAVTGRNRTPAKVHFTTYTLKYNRMHWVVVTGLDQHWEKSTVDAVLNDNNMLLINTNNISDIRIEIPPGTKALAIDQPILVQLDTDELTVHAGSDFSLTFAAHKVNGRWRLGARQISGLRKRHNLQGPIDDALMDSFIFVRPTGEVNHPAIGRWCASELDRAIEHWRRHFRGYARVMDDTEITDREIASSNLILWGDPSSNAVLKRIAAEIPIAWNEKTIDVGEIAYSSEHHVPIAIYPNPLNPSRYVVLNSSFTYRDFAYLNNARQVPKLPDWAIVDVRTPPDSLWPGKIVAADFFDEHWQVKQ